MANNKPKLIDIDELPIPSRSVNYPYDKWEKDIPVGKAIEITDLVPKGRKAGSVSSTIMMAVRRRKLTIRALVRNNRIWIYKPKEIETIE